MYDNAGIVREQIITEDGILSDEEYLFIDASDYRRHVSSEPRPAELRSGEVLQQEAR